MSLAQPATIEGEWRGITWMDSSQTQYGVTVYNAKLSSITTVDVWVDLAKESVVGWSTNSDVKVESGPNNLHAGRPVRVRLLFRPQTLKWCTCL